MRKLALLGLFLLLIVAAAWSGVWFYAAGEAGRQLDAWIKIEDAQGRAWTCPDRAIGGFPLALTLSCKNPTFTGRSGTDTDHWTAASLAAEASLIRPKRLVVSLGSPVSYNSSTGLAAAKLSWSNGIIDIDGLPKPETAAIHAQNLVVDGDFAGAGHQTWNAGNLDLALDVAPQEPDIGFTLAVRGATLPLADSLLGGQAPVEAALSGRFGRADVAGAATLPDAVERWRRSGGRVALANSRLSREAASVSGSGDLGLDDAHRLQGRVDATFVGLEPVLKRYGIGGNVAAAGSLLSTLFGGGQPRTPPQPGALTLPIRFDNGRLGIGPFRTQVALSPLY